MIHNDLKKNGFSLLELLVVVALIGLIALFTVPNINSWSEARKAEKDLSEIIKLIDYAVSSSKSYGKTIVIKNSRSNNKSILNLSQLTSNDPSACTGSTTNDPVYTNNIILNSQIKSKHNSQANSSNSLLIIHLVGCVLSKMVLHLVVVLRLKILRTNLD